MCNRPLCTIPPNSYLHMYEYDSFCHHHHPQPIEQPADIPVEMAPNGGAVANAGNVNTDNVANNARFNPPVCLNFDIFTGRSAEAGLELTL